MRTARFAVAAVLFAAAAGLAAGPAAAQALPGVTATEIRIGNTMAYTGPAAGWGTFGRTFAAFFAMINDEGGINGRLIRFISYDDGYSPPRTVERVRELVEQDDVLMLFGALGTQTNLAVRDYLNERGVPQLFAMTGQSQFFDGANYPWTMSFHPNYLAEGAAYGRYIASEFPGAKVGILYQNDDFGRDYLNGLTNGLAGRSELVALPYDITDATIDPQIAEFVEQGVTVFVNVAATRLAAQAIRRAAEIGWHPEQFISHVSASVGGVLVPAGLENAVGIVSAVYIKDAGWSGFAADQDVVAFRAFMAKYYPEGDPLGAFEAIAYASAWDIVEILRAAGDDLSRENILRIARNLHDVATPMRMPGIRLNTGPTDFTPLEQLQFVRFDGTAFVPFGRLVDATVAPPAR